MARPFSTSLRTILEDPDSSDVYLILIEISHATLGTPLRFANNTENIVSNGNTFTGFPFEIEIPGDENGPPRGRITIQNVDRKIGMAVRELTTPPRIRLQAVLASDLNTVWLDFKHFWFRNIRGDAMQIQGDIDSWDFSVEPWPSRRLTKARFPGLFKT